MGNFNFRILWLCLSKAFCFDKQSLRYPSFRRIIFVLLGFPILLIHIGFCRCCLLLDELFFFRYKKMNTDNCLFIVGSPRSATTFLLELITKNKQQFTAFKLWELVFAPSIVQKYLCLGLAKIDRLLGQFFSKGWKRFEQNLFAKMKGVHDLALSKVEEDEFLFMYIFYSTYLIFIFPDLENQHDLAAIQTSQNQTRKQKSIRFYQQCVQRHLYVFNAKQARIFVSKNPCYVTKLPALLQTFPKAKYIYLRRQLEKSVPSTLSLNQHLYWFFCHHQAINLLRKQTIKMLLTWHQEQEATYQHNPVFAKSLLLPFPQLVKQPAKTMQQIYAWLTLSVSQDLLEEWAVVEEKSKEYRSGHRYGGLLDGERELLVH